VATTTGEKELKEDEHHAEVHAREGEKMRSSGGGIVVALMVGEQALVAKGHGREHGEGVGGKTRGVQTGEQAMAHHTEKDGETLNARKTAQADLLRPPSMWRHVTTSHNAMYLEPMLIGEMPNDIGGRVVAWRDGRKQTGTNGQAVANRHCTTGGGRTDGQSDCVGTDGLDVGIGFMACQTTVGNDYLVAQGARRRKG